VEDQQPDPDDLTGNLTEGPDVSTAVGPEFRSRRTRRLVTLTAGVVAAAFVACGAFAGATLQPYLADRAIAESKINAARTAAAAVTVLWTYTPETIDTLPDRAAEFLSGDFNAQYRAFVESIAVPNQQAQVTTNASVVGVGVETLNQSDAVVIVFANTTTTSPMNRDIPALKYVGYRLQMKHHGSRWLVTKMSTVSFIDLTPQV
jgi:Mce-associated membrane protein